MQIVIRKDARAVLGPSDPDGCGRVFERREGIIELTGIGRYVIGKKEDELGRPGLRWVLKLVDHADLGTRIGIPAVHRLEPEKDVVQI